MQKKNNFKSNTVWSIRLEGTLVCPFILRASQEKRWFIFPRHLSTWWALSLQICKLFFLSNFRFNMHNSSTLGRPSSIPHTEQNWSALLACLLCLPYHIACPIIICLLSTLLLPIIGPNMRNRLNLPENGHSISLSILEAFIFTSRTATISSWGGLSSSLSWDDCLPVTLVYMILIAEFGTFWIISEFLKKNWMLEKFRVKLADLGTYRSSWTPVLRTASCSETSSFRSLTY